MIFVIRVVVVVVVVSVEMTAAGVVAEVVVVVVVVIFSVILSTTPWVDGIGTPIRTYPRSLQIVARPLPSAHLL